MAWYDSLTSILSGKSSETPTLREIEKKQADAEAAYQQQQLEEQQASQADMQRAALEGQNAAKRMAEDIRLTSKGYDVPGVSVFGVNADEQNYGLQQSGSTAPQAQQPGMFDKMKGLFGMAGDYMSKVPGNVKTELKRNPQAYSNVLQLAGAGAGYFAGRESRKDQEDILKKQLADAGAVGQNLAQVTTTPQFAAEKTELEKLMAGGGMTPELQQASQMGIRKGQAVAAGAAQAAREMGQQTGQVSGRGAALASALTGAQMGGNQVADIERQIASDAYNRKLSAAAKLSGLDQSQFQNIQGLAQAKDTMASARASQLAGARGAQMGLEAQQGQALGNLISAGTNVGVAALGGQNYLNPQQQQSQPQINVYATPERQAAAAQVAQTGGTSQPTQPTNTAQAGGQNTAAFNTSNAPQKTASGLVSSSTGGVSGMAGNLIKQGQSFINKIPEKQKQQAISFVGNALGKLKV